MGAPEKYTNGQMARALRETRGCIVIAAERIGCSAVTVKRYVDKSPRLQAIIDSYRKRRVDVAELKLDQAIDRGEPWAIRFTLSTLGKERGYVERTEVTGENGGPQKVEIAYTNDWRAESDPTQTA